MDGDAVPLPESAEQVWNSAKSFPGQILTSLHPWVWTQALSTSHSFNFKHPGSLLATFSVFESGL